MNKYVSYRRVSTKGQEESGLGLSAQATVIHSFIQQSKGQLIKEFTEIETGTSKRQRTVIYEALQFAKLNDAILIVSKVDRLGRNFRILAELQESRVKFISCDNPANSELLLSLFMAMAKEEADKISSRTKAALSELKKKGTKLGGPNIVYISEAGRKAAKELRNMNANIISGKLFIRSYSKGKSSSQVAAEMNRLGMKTATGKNWSHIQVERLRNEIRSEKRGEENTTLLPKSNPTDLFNSINP